MNRAEVFAMTNHVETMKECFLKSYQLTFLSKMLKASVVSFVYNINVLSCDVEILGLLEYTSTQNKDISL